jgi:subtilisin family serine protease
VGATNAFDEAAPYSNQGTPMDVMAPAGTLTTDVRGKEGFDPGDYTSLFSGTSSACPVAAGVAGLLVSLAPSAKGEDIANALIDSARAAPFAMPDAQGHDLTYGYGIVDPAGAMQELVPLETDAGVSGEHGKSKDTGCACGVSERRPRMEQLTLWLLALMSLKLRARRRG